MMLRVSHTHDVIGSLALIEHICVLPFSLDVTDLDNQDQLWGLLSRRLCRSTSMIDPDSVKQILEDELRQPSMKKWIGGSINVFILRKYRNWKEHHDRCSPINLDTGFENMFNPAINMFNIVFICFIFPGSLQWSLHLNYQLDDYP